MVGRGLLLRARRHSSGREPTPSGPEVGALVNYYRSAAGEHPESDEYRSVMVSDRRVLITIAVDKVYGTGRDRLTWYRVSVPCQAHLAAMVAG